MPGRRGQALTKNDYAYAEVLERILTGTLEPGTAIPQARLAEEIGVSTTPLREAIRRLEAEGFVALEAHRDARVTMVSAEEARALYEVRETMDPLAAELAARRRTDEDADRILEALQGLTALQDPSDAGALVAHRAFHRAVYTASHNPILTDTLERLWDRADRYRMVGLRHRGDSETDRQRVAAEHQALADAVVAGDPEAAGATMREHVRASLGRRAIQALETPSAPG